MYLSSCDREIGIILDVTSQTLKMLTLKGEVKEILRHEIIFFAYYPQTTIPIEEMHLVVRHSGNTSLDGTPLKTVKIKTLQDHQLVDLVEGWPINFTNERISFLTTKGVEVIIDRENIWQIERIDTAQTVTFPIKVEKKYQFVHPYSLQHCPVEYEGNLNSEEVQTIDPQQTLSDQVLIKKELDRLKEEHKKIVDYHDSQTYYAVAQINNNQISLGYWFASGSRNASSVNRNFNTFPVLINELSDGPFETQQLIIIGSSPQPYSIHEEPQNQLYYRIKGSFVRFAAYANFNQLFLTEENYYWKKEDLDRLDNRAFEGQFFEGGLDFFNYTGTIIGSGIVYGARIKNRFISGTMPILSYRFNYRNHLLQAQLTFGNGSEESKSEAINELGLLERIPFKASFSYSRFNFAWFGFEKWHPFYSLIVRNFETTQETTDYSSLSVTNVGYLTYQYNRKYAFSGYLGLEILNKAAQIDDQPTEESNIFLKAGMNVTLTF